MLTCLLNSYEEIRTTEPASSDHFLHMRSQTKSWSTRRNLTKTLLLIWRLLGQQTQKSFGNSSQVCSRRWHAKKLQFVLQYTSTLYCSSVWSKNTAKNNFLRNIFLESLRAFASSKPPRKQRLCQGIVREIRSFCSYTSTSEKVFVIDNFVSGGYFFSLDTLSNWKGWPSLSSISQYTSHLHRSTVEMNFPQIAYRFRFHIDIDWVRWSFTFMLTSEL